MAEVEEKKEVGRPKDYGEELLARAREYVDEANDIEEKDATGRVLKLKVKIPTIEGMAYHLKVSRQVLYDWEKIYPDFLYIMDELRAKQARELVQKGLSGEYNPTIAKVLLTKHGYREGIEQTGKDGDKLIPDNAELQKIASELNDLRQQHITEDNQAIPDQTGDHTGDGEPSNGATPNPVDGEAQG